PTFTNIVNFSGGKLADVNVAPLTFSTTNNAVVSVGVGSTLLTAGSGYSAPKVTFIDPLAAHTVPNTATGFVYGTVTPGTINIAAANQGTGYTSAPIVTVVPDPTDLNLANILPA